MQVHEVSTQLELITPEQALEILKFRNPRNRPIRKNLVERIAFDIISDKWQVTHQGIAFNSDGQLMDGQHRLSAIVKAKKPVHILVTYGVNDESMPVIDSGSARTAADALGLKHGTPSPSAASAAIKNYLIYCKYPSGVWSHIIVPTNSEVCSYYEENTDLVNKAVQTALACRRRFKYITRTAVATVFLIVHREGGDVLRYEEFIESLSKGSNLEEGSPLIAYRNFLMNGGNTHRYKQQAGIARLIQCFNYWQKNRQIKSFRGCKFPPMPELEIL